MFKFYFTNTWNDFAQAKSCTWNIVEFAITHQEGHVAKASLLAGNFTTPTGAYLGIFEDDRLLFQGVVSGQFEHQQHLTKVEVLCISPTFEMDLKTLVQETTLPYNADFFQGKSCKPSDYLEAGNLLFYWNRVTGNISLSDYFQGKRCINVSGQYLDKAFKIQQISMPLGSAVIELKVHWTQSLGGTFNASSYIERAFPEKIIATLTPTALTQSWPKEDQRLGMGRRQSGYRVEHSKICPISFEGMQSYTKLLCTKIGEHQKNVKAKIHYFKTTLKIHWQYNQQRMEKMLIKSSLNHIQHRLTKHRIRHIPITISLPKSEQAVFFETSKGHEFVRYATAIITSQLKASARCIQVQYTLPWNLGRDLTIDDSLIDTEKFIGKITCIRHVVKGLQKRVEVTVGGMIQPGDLRDVSSSQNCEYFQEAINDEIQSSDPLLGITYPKLNPKDLITQIEVKNSAQTQELHLLQNQYPVRDCMMSVLQEVPTSIYLTLKDLRSNKSLDRCFEKVLPVVEVRLKGQPL